MKLLHFKRELFVSPCARVPTRASLCPPPVEPEPCRHPRMHHTLHIHRLHDWLACQAANPNTHAPHVHTPGPLLAHPPVGACAPLGQFMVDPERSRPPRMDHTLPMHPIYQVPACQTTNLNTHTPHMHTPGPLLTPCTHPPAVAHAPPWAILWSTSSMADHPARIKHFLYTPFAMTLRARPPISYTHAPHVHTPGPLMAHPLWVRAHPWAHPWLTQRAANLPACTTHTIHMPCTMPQRARPPLSPHVPPSCTHLGW